MNIANSIRFVTVRAVALFALTFLLISLPGSVTIDAQDSSAIETDEKDSSDKTSIDQENDLAIPSIAQKVADFQKHEGFVPFYWDDRHGKIWLEIDLDQPEFLFSHGLSTGLGSNPVGLDRGQLGGQHVVHFKRIGPKVFLIERNLRFRATANNPAEQRAVAESFAHSIIWSSDVAAEQEKKVLVDASTLMMKDWHNVINRLKNAEQGDFSFDSERSAVYVERCKNFPDNSELESSLTFSSQQPGRLVNQTTPSSQSLSLRVHYSFVRLPDDNYRPRVFDPRTPSIHITFADYSAPIDGPLEKRWITRHRLIKKDPAAEVSEAIEPIVYYVDPGAPELIRQALIDGASWWNDAYEAIGFKNAFQVKVLPLDADPMDVRYNTIQWVHRSTRGWSFGGSVTDPRTGEIIKGHVTLGSLRVRQDRLIFEGLEPRFLDQACSCCGVAGIEGDTKLAILDDRVTATEIALARIRQLSAHEVGHTLGFVHNFAASTYGDRASVMDYPAPRIKITDGKIDLTDAYGVGIGGWDKFAVKYSYSQFADELEEVAALKQMVEQSIAEGQLFMSDADARPVGAAHPMANLWDNGSEPTAELNHLLQVRSLALGQFGASTIPAGTPMSMIEETLAPIYLLHRYQIDAVSKMIGGNVYTYAVAGDQQVPTSPIPIAEQLEALKSLINVLSPEHLEIDPSIIKLISPPRSTSVRSAERFHSSTSPMFDPMFAAETVADMVYGRLLNHERVARLANATNYSGRFGPQELLMSIIDGAWNNSNELQSENQRQISRVVRWRLNKHLLDLAANEDASIDVRIAARSSLDRVQQYCTSNSRRTNRQDRDFAAWINADIERFLNRPHTAAEPTRTEQAPAGSPIGN